MSHFRSPFLSIPALGAAAGVAVALSLMLSGAWPTPPASAQPATASAAAATSIGQRRTALGTLLVNSRGLTLYAFSRDHGSDQCAHVAGCPAVWPVVRTAGRPLAGPGVNASLLGTTGLPGGARQVTYAGHPLYTYAFDRGPGETGYVGVTQFGGVWRALTTSGRLIG